MVKIRLGIAAPSHPITYSELGVVNIYPQSRHVNGFCRAAQNQDHKERHKKNGAHPDGCAPFGQVLQRLKVGNARGSIPCPISHHNSLTSQALPIVTSRVELTRSTNAENVGHPDDAVSLRLVAHAIAIATSRRQE